MKLHEVLDLSPTSKFKGKPITLPAIFDKKNIGIGAKPGIGATTVTVKSSGKDGKVYGQRTFFQKS